MQKIFGYDYTDGKYVPNETESEIVRFTFSQNQHYHEESPAELVEIVFNEHRDYDPDYTMEMAREDAKNDGRIIHYVTRDVNEKFKDYLLEQRVKEDQIVGIMSENGRDILISKHEEIIDRTTYRKAMKAKKDRDAR